MSILSALKKPLTVVLAASAMVMAAAEKLLALKKEWN